MLVAPSTYLVLVSTLIICTFYFFTVQLINHLTNIFNYRENTSKFPVDYFTFYYMHNNKTILQLTAKKLLTAKTFPITTVSTVSGLILPDVSAALAAIS